MGYASIQVLDISLHGQLEGHLNLTAHIVEIVDGTNFRSRRELTVARNYSVKSKRSLPTSEQ
jgi:hypothetical protein